jgi:hypothetical protein
MTDEDAENTPDLSISPAKVCYLIAKARPGAVRAFL